MGCKISLLTTLKSGSGLMGPDTRSYDDEPDTILTYVGEVDSMKDRDGKDLHRPAKEVTYSTVADLVSRLGVGERQSLARIYENAKARRLTKKDIENCNFISNITIDELHDTRRLSRKYWRIPENLDGESYVIIDCSLMKYGGDAYSGMLTRADGSKVLLSRGQADAKKIFRFLNARGALKAGFAEAGFEEESKTWENRELIGKIAEKMSKKEKGRLGGRSLTLTDLLYDFLENAQSYTPMEIDGRTVNIQKVLDQAVYDVTMMAEREEFRRRCEAAAAKAREEGREYREADVERPHLKEHWIESLWKYDELGAALYTASSGGDGPYELRIGKRRFHEILCKYVDGFKERYPFDRFVNMNADEIDTLLFGSEGVLLGHDEIKDMKVVSVGNTRIIESGGEKLPPKKKVVSADKYMRETWDSVVGAANLSDIDPAKGTLGEFRKRDMTVERRNRILEDLGFAVTDKDGTWQVKAKEEGGKVKFYYEVVEERVTNDKYSPSYIVLKSPFSMLGDPKSADTASYDFQALFEPVNADAGERYGNVKDGQYHGMYVYARNDGVVDGEGSGTKYYISRHKLNRATDNKPYSTLGEALDAVDRANAHEELADSAYLAPKQSGRDLYNMLIEGRGIRTGQTLTVLDYQLKSVEYIKTPKAFRNLFELNGEKFHETFDRECGTAVLYTPEMCATWLMAQYAGVGDDLPGVSDGIRDSMSMEEVIRAIKGNHAANADRWAEEVVKIAGAKRKDYAVISASDAGAKYGHDRDTGKLKRIDKFKNRRNPLQNVKLLPLVNNGTGLNLRGDEVGGVRIGEYMNRYLDDAVEKVRKEYANVHLVTIDELGKMDEFKGKTEEQLKLVNGFYKNGDVYINRSAERRDQEKALYEETAHMLLGVLKVKDPEAYRSVIDGWENTLRHRSEGQEEGEADAGKGDARLSVALGRFVDRNPEYSNFARSDLIEEYFAKEFSKNLMKSADLHVINDVDQEKAAADALSLSGNKFNKDVFEKAFDFVFRKLRDAYNGERASGERGGADGGNGLGFTDWLKGASQSGEARISRQTANLVKNLIERGDIMEEC